MAVIRPSYRPSTTIVIHPENVGSSSDFTFGVESDAYDNRTNRDIDVLISGLWTSDASASSGSVLVFVGAPRDDTPNYPDVFDGTNSVETISASIAMSAALKLAAAVNVNVAGGYSFGPFSVAQLFGGVVPPRFFLFITHNTGFTSNTTAGNHIWRATGVSLIVVT